VNYRPSGFKKNQTNPSVEETTSISWKEIKDRLKEKRYSNIYQPSVEKTKTTTTTTIVAW
jgi:6-pyruvoyl-tetrahydropterin synthase